MKEKRVYIIGAGAIGKVLAVFLKLAKKNVILIRGTLEDQSIRRELISVELPDQTTVQATVEVSTINNYSRLEGIVVLTNKSFGNAGLALKLHQKIQDAPIVILQNGLNVEQPFVEKGFPQIYRCVLFATSQPASAGGFRYRPVATSPIGVIKGNFDDLSNVVQELNTVQFPFKAEKDIQSPVWTKAIVNSVFNSICPLLAVDNGIFWRNGKALEMAKRVIMECVALAALKGITLDAGNVLDTLLLISKSSDGQFISTHLDIVNNRRTEIETLNMAFLQIAKSLEEEPIVRETGLLGELVSLKSELSLAQAKNKN